MADDIVTVKATAQLSKAGAYPFNVRTHVGFLDSGQPVHAYLGTVLVDCRPECNRKAA